MASATLEQFNCNHTIYKGVLGIAKYSFIFFTCPKKVKRFSICKYLITNILYHI